jgi:hypothetical protein
MNAKILRRLLLVIVAVGASVGAAVAFAAPAAKADFALSLGSSSSSVTPGQSSSYNVTISRTGGFAGSVTGSVSGAPSGVSATITPNPAGSAVTQVVVSLQTSAGTPTGSYTLVFTGTSGSLQHSVNLPLTVSPTSTFTLAVTNDNQTVGQGGSGAFTIAVTRKSFTGAISFAVSGAPAQSNTTFTPLTTSGNVTSLQVDTAANTKQGSYDLVVTGTSGALTSSVTAHLTVSAGSNGKDFTITGDVGQALSPGVTAPIDLSLANSNNQPINITSLVVSVTGTSKAACATDNFSVRQFTGPYPVTVPAGATRKLSQLGISQTQMPALTFIDKPSNQDACKSTKITLGYTGVGGNG